MKKTFIYFAILLFSVTFSTNSNAVTSSNGIVSSTEIVKPNPTPNSVLDAKMNDFLSLTPAKYKEMTGKRLGIMGSIKLKFAQSQLKKQLKKSEAGGDGKSQVIALVLVLLVGVLGIHRFYLGYTTYGIIQLLTLGGCGIWALIDLIMIATGSLKPKDGEYDTKL
jgi:TM2 domain-containing membrane protein YozV